MSSSIDGHDFDPRPPPEKNCIRKLSLEMCTENLGTETGIHSSSPQFFLPPENEFSGRIRRPKSEKTRSVFPPPLSSIAGGGGVLIESHREEGRLVIRARNSCSLRIYFKAERGDGRLKLYLPRNPFEGEPESDPDPEEHFWSGSRCQGEGERRLTGSSFPLWVAIS